MVKQWPRNISGTTVRRLILVFAVVPLLAFAGATAVAGPAIPAGAAPSTKTAPALTPAAEARRKELEAAVPRVVEAAAKLIDAGKRREAATPLVTLRNALGEPRDVRVEALLAKIALAENRPDEAFKLVAPWANDRTKYDPALADCYLVAADAQLALGKSDAALIVFDWVASSARGEALILAAEGCGKCRIAMQDFKEAIRNFEFALKILKTVKDDYGTYDKLGARLKGELVKARQMADNKGEPQATFDRAGKLRTEGKFREALELYEGIIKEYPEHPLTHPAGYLAAECLAGQKKYEEALKRAGAFIEESLEGPWRGQAHLLIGDLLLEHFFDAQSAQWHYGAILYPALLKKDGAGAARAAKRQPFDPPDRLADPRPDPSWAEVLPDGCERFGLTFYMQSRFDLAEKYLAEELRLRPTRKMVGYTILNNTQRLLEMCRNKKSPVYFNKLVMTGDARVQTLLFLASAYLEAGEVAKAGELLENLDRPPLSLAASATQKAYAQMERAEALRLSFRFPEAIKALEKFEGEYQAAPMAPMALMDKASTHLTVDDKLAAVKTYQRIYSLYPTSTEAPRAMYFEGYIYYFTEQWEKSLTAFRLLRSRYPKSWEAGRVAANEIPELEEKSAGKARP